MRPTLRFLSDDLIDRILAEAKEILLKLGVEVHNDRVLELLADNGARIELKTKRAFLTGEMVDRAVASAPSGFKLYDTLGEETHDFSGHNVFFTPGSAALNILDHKTQTIRRPNTDDYVLFTKLVSRLPHITSQATAFIPSDVPESVSDSYRLFLSLLYCEKPVVTGAFTIKAFEVMKELQLAVRGSKEALRDKPITVFSCCPTAPLKWCDVTSQNVLDCAEYSIPIEFISMPLSGFMSPTTLVGSVIQHTAETLSGVVISQLARPGTPILYGGSPAAFDVRYETTPMGAVETQMIDCAYNEIGKHLNIPTQAYIALSDSKRLDAQAGLESSMGATLAVLAGINNISGPGMLDFESCQSMEKLVVDNEICGMTLRMKRGIEPREDFPAIPLFEELLKEKHLLISEHTRRHMRDEHYFPGPAIDRANLSRWTAEGEITLGDRAAAEVKTHIDQYEPVRLQDDVQKELVRMMEGEARNAGMDTLPGR